MGKAGYNIEEIRIITREPELTDIYIFLRAWGDSPIGVEGWHHKTFPASVPSLEALQEALKTSDYVVWPLEAPQWRNIRPGLAETAYSGQG